MPECVLFVCVCVCDSVCVRERETGRKLSLTLSHRCTRPNQILCDCKVQLKAAERTEFLSQCFSELQRDHEAFKFSY